MTPNEARYVLAHDLPQTHRKDVIGRVYRSECAEAYKTLARHAIEVSQRFTRKRERRKRAAYLEMAGIYRTAAYNLEDKTR